MKIKVKSALIFLALACLAVAVVLMILPYGVEMIWGAPPGETARITYCAYFDFLPYGYGHFFPPITAIVTTVSMVFVLLYIFLNKFRLATLVLTLIAALFSILAMILPFNITAISVVVPILLATAAILQIVHTLRKKV